MRRSRFIIGMFVTIALLSTSAMKADAQAATSVTSFSSLRSTLKAVKTPKISQPEWLKLQIADEKAALAKMSSNVSGTVFTYTTTTSGSIYANFSEFQTLANQTLNDPRGWARMGVSFKQVPSGGDFTLVLAQASTIPSYSSGCSAQWSCNAGRYVLINQDRWMGTTTAWKNSGGSLRDYRNMVVNHETGHWLGHSHAYCSGAGQLASVMQQQSIDLQGCSFNPWPLASELWTSR